MDLEFTNIYEAVLEGQSTIVEQKVQEAIHAGRDPLSILNNGLIGGMEEVGRRFECGEFYIPDLLVAASAMRAGVRILKDQFIESEMRFAGRAIIGTVQGDLHDIGKNLVCMMLEGAGFEVVDLGVDIHPGKFIQAIEKTKANIVGLSALLTTTMPRMIDVIEAIEHAGLREEVKIIIGGAPITEEYSRQIGADAYAPDASRAVRIIKNLLKDSSGDIYKTK